MTQLAVVLIAFAALIGITMAVQHVRGRTPPSPALAILHGLLAVSGVVALLLYLWDAGFGGILAWSFGLFVVAALGGLYLVSHHMRQKPLPGAVILVHGLLAAIAFLILLTAVVLVP